MEKLRLISFVFYWNCAFFLQSCLAEELPINGRINGNISVILENWEVNLFVLRGDEITRHVKYMPLNSPIRPPCRTCDPTYNIFHINNQYLIPDHSKIYVVNPNSSTLPYEVDIRSCDPVQLYSVKQNAVWVQCAFKDGLFEVVELRTGEDNVTWYRHDSQNIVFSRNVSRNGLVLVKEKDGENVTFLYYGSGVRLERKGLEEFSVARYSTHEQCGIIEELFYINDELILIQCVLKDNPTEHVLVLFNTSNPSQSFDILNRFSSHLQLVKVHVFEGYIVLLSSDTVIIRNPLRSTEIEQLLVFPPGLSTNGIFVRLKDIIYFVCTSRKEIYFIDIVDVLGGNITAYHRIESSEEICTDMTCSPFQYIEPLLFVPLKTNELAMYTLDPFKLHTTADILTSHYRYFFTYTMPEFILDNNTISTIGSNDSNVLVDDERSSEQSISNGLSVGVIAGITVAVFVVISCVVIVIGTWYRYHKRRSSRYYQYQTSEVRFERADNNQEEGIVIVSGRFDNPIWPLNDGDSASVEEQDNLVNILTPGLNNQSAATNAKKKKNTNATGGYNAPSNVDGDNGSEMSYGFETREEPVNRQQYMDSLVIGTLNSTII